MTDKKYQVFISSTYEDLKEERKAVEETIIRAGDFPVGMEAFPAADEEQFDFIKTVIAQCDYYVLIIAGRYGSLATDGKSYTEKEYDYAVEIGVPVLVMLREEREKLPAHRSEFDGQKREKLDKFINSVSAGRIRKSWGSLDGLKLAVREALDHAKVTKTRPGWVRGDQPTSSETLGKLVATQEEVSRLRKLLAEATPSEFLTENIAGLDRKIDIKGSRFYSPRGSSRTSSKGSFIIETSFGEVFELLAPHLLEPKIDGLVGGIISETLWRRHHDETGRLFSLQDEQFQTLKIQFIALKLISVDRLQLKDGGGALFWSLTPFGKQEMIRRRVITQN
jgi:hypothetical protein